MAIRAFWGCRGSSVLTPASPRAVFWLLNRRLILLYLTVHYMARIITGLPRTLNETAIPFFHLGSRAGDCRRAGDAGGLLGATRALARPVGAAGEHLRAYECR